MQFLNLFIGSFISIFTVEFFSLFRTHMKKKFADELSVAILVFFCLP